MKKTRFLAPFLFAIAGLVVACKEPNQAFSPGDGDPRIVGTWQLTARGFMQKYTYQDSIFSFQPDTVINNKDTLYTRKRVTTYITRDSIRYALKTYPAAPPQTLTFGKDGSLLATGSEMTYYTPIRYFRVDSTRENGLGINLFVNTNRANVSFRQGVVFKPNSPDSLQLTQSCEQSCFLKFKRVR